MISPVMMCNRSSSRWGNHSKNEHRLKRFIVKKFLVVFFGLMMAQSLLAAESANIVTVDVLRAKLSSLRSSLGEGFEKVL